jgi:hypothetical protein
MFVLIVATTVVVGLLAAVGLAAILIFGIGSSKKRKARRHAVLHDSCTRMKTVVAELLEKVNDLDQTCKFVEDKRVLAASKDRLAVAATDLVTVTDCLPSIEQLLSEKRYDDAADLLSASSRVIEKVLRIIAQVQPGLEEYKALPDGSVKLKLPKHQQGLSNKKNES